MQASGFYFDGSSSQRHVAQLSLDESGHWQLNYANQTHRYRPDEVRVASQLGNSQRMVNFADGGHFASDDHLALNQMLRRLRGTHHGWLHRLESSWKWVLASCLVLILALYLGMTRGAPLVARVIVAALPTSIEQQIGEQTMNLLDGHLLKPSQLTPERQQQLQLHFAPLLADWPEHSLQVHFRHLPGAGANAFALPGGDLVFLDDLVKLAEQDDELSAVLVHEIGHVIHRHGMRRLVQNALLYWAATALTGDLSAASEAVASAPAFLMNMAYSRSMENEADDFALQQLQRHSIAPANFASIMRKLDAESDTGDGPGQRLLHLLSSHPDTAERIRKFEH